jgi:UTP--glucose-1-phosphate uridylyltransferase
MKIKKAVIPAAGLGTRFLPATKAIPKEMIPIIDIPMIQYIVEEAVRSGIEDIVLITARNKHEIEDHFDYAYEVEKTLTEKGNAELAEVSRKIAGLCNLISIRQKNPMGLGHAIACAEPVIGKEPFAVLLGDDMIDSQVPCTKQLIDIFEKTGSSVVAVMEVSDEDVSKYGIVEKNPDGTVSRLIEKPKPTETRSRLALPGRYVLSNKIFDCIRETQPGRNGEIQLTDALQLLLKKEKIIAHHFEGTRYDTGDRLGFIDATLAFALKRPDLAPGVMGLMKKHLQQGSLK